MTPHHPSTARRALVALLAVAVLAGLVVAAFELTAPGPPTVPTCPTAAACTVKGPHGNPVELVPWSWSAETAFYTPPTPLPPAAPGTLIRMQALAPQVTLPPDSVAWRILYHSTSVSGADIADSGVIIAPDVAPPRGGFPLVTYAHATTGLAAACAPSRFADFEIPSLNALVAAGDAVVATDYQGLGTPGPHPYIVGVSEGHSVLDAARAAQQVPGLRVSDHVVAFGYSQGGQAVLFAGQIADSYAPDLHLRGVVAEAPPVELPELVAHLETSAGFVSLLDTLVVSWSDVFPGLPLTSLVTPAAAAVAPAANYECGTQLVTTLAGFTPQTLLSPGLADNAEWQSLLAANSPGGAPMGMPALVVNGGQDPIIPPLLTDAYVHTACTVQHDQLTHGYYPTADHGTIIVQASGQVQQFIADRLAGAPAPPTCVTTTTIVR